MILKFKINYSQKYTLNFLLQIARNKKLSKIVKRKHNVTNRVYNKIFCIGFNKTGTTSIGKVLTNFGFSLGNQAVAEVLSEAWAKKKTDRIINYCYTADAFQDLPFSTPNLYKELDKYFPGSKFILTIRDNEHQWFNSLVRFHTKIFATDKTAPPTETDLQNALYRYKGFLLDTKKWFYNYPNVPLYDEKYYKQMYLNHIEDVKQYFKERDDLLILNVAEKGAYQKLANFLDMQIEKDAEFPWLNKT